MHNLRIFFMGSPACGLNFKPQVPRCNSLTEIDFRREQIRFRGEAQERGVALAAYILWIKTDFNLEIMATAF
ncbi:MAG: hypothetical protein WBM78_23285 [Desulfobacterales bacterium]